jgi:NADPH:quinone reductase-like Zn-dependent oxidoreductase
MTMRAVVAQKIGEPDEVLTIQRLPVPEPGPGQVLVHVVATPVHASDLHIVRGRYGYTPPFPTVPGVECVGTVAALGPGLDEGGLRLGQRVVPLGVTGTWQEFVVADAERVLPVPDSMSDSTASQLIVSPLTAWLLVDRLALEPGDWLLQTAAGSTVGQLVIALSNHLGFHTLNVVRRRATVQKIRDLGGTEVICTEDEPLPERLAQLTDGRSITKAIDCVAGQVGADVSRALAPGGELIVYGALSTHRQTDFTLLTIPLAAPSMIFESKTVRGFFLHHWFSTTPPERVGRDVGAVMSLLENSSMVIPEGQAVPVENTADAAHAARLAEAPARGGKPLLTF